MLRFGIITAYAAEDHSSASLIQACGALGRATVIHPDELIAEVDERGATVFAGGEPLSSFDVLLLVRGFGPEGNHEVQLSIYRTLSEGGPLVINALEALLRAQDKLQASACLARAGLPTPRVKVVQRVADLERALAGLGRAVAKPQWGSLGEGIELLPPGEEGMLRAEQLLDAGRTLYLQDWVDHGGRDLRAFVVGDRVEAAVERIAPPGELRTNHAAGGRSQPTSLSPALESLAVDAAKTIGLEWAGVDLVVDREGRASVLEVNGSPNWRGILRATGRDMGEAIAAHAARRVLKQASRQSSWEGG